MSCIYCNNEVHPKRVEILKKRNALITCIECAEAKVTKVTGFQVNNDKACREIQICTQEEGKRLMKLQRKGGGATGGPGFGKNAGKIVYTK